MKKLCSLIVLLSVASYVYAMDEGGSAQEGRDVFVENRLGEAYELTVDDTTWTNGQGGIVRITDLLRFKARQEETSITGNLNLSPSTNLVQVLKFGQPPQLGVGHFCLSVLAKQYRMLQLRNRTPYPVTFDKHEVAAGQEHVLILDAENKGLAVILRHGDRLRNFKATLPDADRTLELKWQDDNPVVASPELTFRALIIASRDSRDDKAGQKKRQFTAAEAAASAQTDQAEQAFADFFRRAGMNVPGGCAQP